MDEMIQLGFMCSIIAVFLLTILLKKLFRKDNSFKCKYDERQQLVRGRGFQYGFFGWLIFNSFYILLETGFGKQYMDTSMALFSGLVTGIIIYASYAIWNEGYFSLNIYPKRVVAVLAFVMVLNIICGIHNIKEGILKNGKLTFLSGANLICAAALMIVLTVLAVKWCFDQRKAE